MQNRIQKMVCLNDIDDQFGAIERKVQTLPGELDSIVASLDHSKLQTIFTRLEKDCDRLYEKQCDSQNNGIFRSDLIFETQPLSFRPITSEDRARWREAFKSRIAVEICKGKIEVIPVFEIIEKDKTTLSRIASMARQEGYLILGWPQYLKLLNEIGKLIRISD